MNVEIIAILGIVVLESIALVTGNDGQLLATALMLIAGLAGYKIGIYIQKDGNRKAITKEEEDEK